MTTTQVRRLTPRECERLMGWPDDHTAHRIDHKTGAVIPQADSSRYRQCGNGMAAPVVEWIAHRINATEETP
jgi:DNA (cytosine-5)-methyltransferase 1